MLKHAKYCKIIAISVEGEKPTKKLYYKETFLVNENHLEKSIFKDHRIQGKIETFHNGKRSGNHKIFKMTHAQALLIRFNETESNDPAH